MPDTDVQDRTFTEAEMLAIVADRVTAQVATLTAECDQLKTEKAALQTQLDVAESAKVAAEAAKAETEREFASFKEDIEREKAAAGLKETRVAKLREVASHLADEWFQDEDRLGRIVAMDEAGFEGYVADMKATSTVAPTTTVGVPRETAMAGAPVNGTPELGQAARNFLLPKLTKEG